jgi:hypothetical protein
MADVPEHPDDRLPAELQQRLGELYRTGVRVPPELDAAILLAGRRRLANVRRFRMLLRWGGAAAAAAAAVAVAIWQPWRQPQFAPAPMVASQMAAPRWTMLDAYRLARDLDAGEKPDAKWDVNHDGVVDRNDVDEIAHEAVRLQ